MVVIRSRGTGLIMNFILQRINGLIRHDFVFMLNEAIAYNQWVSHNLGEYYAVLAEIGSVSFSTLEGIPVGTLEYVDCFAKRSGLKPHYPINIPAELMCDKHLGRECFYGNVDSLADFLSKHNTAFIKSKEKYKDICGIVNNIKLDTDYKSILISEVIEITSEWRAFVYLGTLVGLNNYSGDFTQMPMISKIDEMIKAYKNAPGAYTLDVAVTCSGDTVVIEVHPFVSCGLYGFKNLRILPRMFYEGYKYYTSII